jgi:transketolase
MPKKKLDREKINQRILEIGKGKGHVPSALSCVELLCTVYEQTKKNDIVILSKGHAALAQYVILNELGRLPDDVLATYGEDGGLSEHSTYMPEYGVFASTGSLGHGLAIGMGYAIAYPKRLITVVLGDGEVDEGSVMEAFKIMVDLELPNCSTVIDANGTAGFRFTPLTRFQIQKGMYTIRPGEYHNINGKGWGKEQGTIAGHYQKP